MGNKVDGSYTTLIQGISQQAPIDRLDGQHELMENMSNDPEKGLLRRPATDLMGVLGSVADVYKDIEVNNEQFIMAIHEDSINMYSLDGAVYPVNGTASAKNYLRGTTRHGVLSKSGKVYISNPTVITEMLPDVKNYIQDSAIVHLIGGQYGRKYEVVVKYNGLTKTAVFNSPDGSVTAHGAQISTTYIAEQLKTALVTALPEFKVSINSDVILMEYTGAPALTGFNVTVNDGDGGVNIFGFTNTLGDVGKLSRFAPHDFVVCITGSESSYADDWYLRFNKENGLPTLEGTGLWVETVAPDVVYKFNQDTMPHVLTREEDGSFTISVGDWEDRRVGDDDSNPQASFIGKPIEDISLFQGRLVFLSGSNAILSRSGVLEDFWKNSAVTLVDDDPIDISSATTRSSPIMRKSVPHNRDLVIFADTAQFIIFGRNAITPRNTSLVLTTTYEANLSASPVSGGKNIFYAMDHGGYTGIKEFYTEGDIEANASRPITAHCTRYLEGSVKQMQTSTNFDMLLVQTAASKKTLYVYEYIWINSEKVQAAWSSWIMQDDVLFFTFIMDAIYIVTKFNDTARLLKMRLDRGFDVELFQVHLDNKLHVQDVHEIFTIPEELQFTQGLQFIQGPGCPEEGLEVPLYQTTDTEVILQYSMNGGEVICGTEYKSRVILTSPVVRDAKKEPVTTGVLNVHHFTVSCRESGYITATVSSPFREDVVMNYDVRIVGAVNNIIGESAIASFDVVFPFLGDVTKSKLELSSSRHTPLRIIQITWKGDYVKQGTHL